MSDPIQAGDVVVLKSGGPMMVVHNANDAQVVSCTWFVEGEPKRAQFERSALVKVA